MNPHVLIGSKHLPLKRLAWRHILVKFATSCSGPSRMTVARTRPGFNRAGISNASNPALQSLVAARNMGPETTNSAKPNSCSAISTLSHPSQTIRHISWPPAPKFTSVREPKKTRPRCQTECNSSKWPRNVLPSQRNILSLSAKHFNESEICGSGFFHKINKI